MVVNRPVFAEPEKFVLLRSRSEWGPPVQRAFSIDWELYSVLLIVSDVFVTIAWHIVVRDVLKHVRLRWLSPSFRFSIAYIYGSVRLGCIQHLFRAKPDAACLWVHVTLFLLHVVFGFSSLVFNDGPWRWLRGNHLGAYKLSHFNPYTALPKLAAGLRRLVDYFFWGSVQWCVKLLPDRRRGRYWARARPCARWFAPLRLMPRSLSPRRRRRRSSATPAAQMCAEETLETPAQSQSEPCESTPVMLLRRRKRGSGDVHDAQLPSDSNSWSHWERQALPSSPPPRVPSLSPLLPSPQSSTQSLLQRVSSTGSLGVFLPGGSSDDDIDNYEEESGTYEPELVLQGPGGHLYLTVSPQKWNESKIFWARPALEAYFSHPSDADSLLLDAMDDIENVADVGATVAPFAEYSSLTRGTILLRGDGIILQVMTAPPQLRTIVAYAALWRDKTIPQHNRETVVELVGSRVRCSSGVHVLYGYADYRSFGSLLTEAQRETLLWLLNLLNDADLTELRWYRCQSFVEAARRYPPLSRGRGGGSRPGGARRRRISDRRLMW